MSVNFKFESGFYENFTLYKNGVRPAEPTVIKKIQKIVPVNLEQIKNQNHEKIENCDKNLQQIENDLNTIQTQNNLLLSHDNYKKLKFSNLFSDNNCGEEQKATVDFLTNLQPENICNYKKIKKEYIDCKKGKIILN